MNLLLNICLFSLIVVSSNFKSIIKDTKIFNSTSKSAVDINNKIIIEDYVLTYDKGSVNLNNELKNYDIILNKNTYYTFILLFSDSDFFKLTNNDFHHTFYIKTDYEEDRKSFVGSYKLEKDKEYSIGTNLFQSIYFSNQKIFLSLYCNVDSNLNNFSFKYSYEDIHFLKVCALKGNYQNYLKENIPDSKNPKSSKINILSDKNNKIELDANKIDCSSFLQYIQEYYIYYDKYKEEYHRLNINNTDNAIPFGKYRTYSFVYMEDSFQKINISVKIIDNIPPIVKSKWKNLTISYKEINNFNIENYIEIYDATPIKEIKLLNLPQPYSIGIFLLKIIVIDSISNSTEIELNINVIDDIFPTLIFPSYIEISKKNFLSENDYFNIVDAKDDFQVLKTVHMTNYLENSNKEGIYFITCKAEDENGNSISGTTKIKIIENENNFFWIVKNEIFTYINNKIDILSAINEMNLFFKKTIVSYTPIDNMISLNSFNTPGIFNCELIVQDENGKSDLISLKINVLNKTIDNKQISFIEKIVDFFTKVINWLNSISNSIIQWIKSLF